MLEALHKIRNYIMCDAVFVGKGDWRFPKVADLERRVGAQDFGADVITINSFAREIDDSQRSALKSQRDDCIVDIADLADLRVREHSANGIDAFDLPHEPAREVDIMNPHIDHDSAAMLRIEVFQAGTEGVARRCLERYSLADRPLIEFLFGRPVSTVKPSHKTHIKEYA